MAAPGFGVLVSKGAHIRGFPVKTGCVACANRAYAESGTTGNMPMELGQIEAVYRYPVKSMRGEPLDSADVGWHGSEGDRRLAFRRIGDSSNFPWLSASKLPELVLFTPRLPNVRTPEGDELPAFGEALAADVGRRLGAPVQMMELRNGIFDDAAISVITSGTAGEICRLSGVEADVRRFRPNIVIRSRTGVAFEEDAWVGGVLTFGDDGPAVSVTSRDVRCSMVNFDPDDGSIAPEVMKAVVRANDNNAGVYATVVRTGRVAPGQTVLFKPGE